MKTNKNITDMRIHRLAICAACALLATLESMMEQPASAPDKEDIL